MCGRAGERPHGRDFGSGSCIPVARGGAFTGSAARRTVQRPDISMRVSRARGHLATLTPGFERRIQAGLRAISPGPYPRSQGVAFSADTTLIGSPVFSLASGFFAFFLRGGPSLGENEEMAQRP